MYKLTERRADKSKAILDRYAVLLRRDRTINCASLEAELREALDLGYRALKDIFIDMLRMPAWRLVAAYYMQHSNPSGPVSEFKTPLAQLYGATSEGDKKLAELREAFWDRALPQTRQTAPATASPSGRPLPTRPVRGGQ